LLLALGSARLLRDLLRAESRVNGFPVPSRQYPSKGLTAMRFESRTIGVVLAAAMMAVAGGSMAAGESPAEIIKARQEKFKDLGKQAKALVGQLKSGALDKAAAPDEAKKIAEYAHELPTWFPKGTGPDSGVKTLAKSEIWTQPDDFKAAADKLQTEADKLVQVAATGDIAAVGAQFQATGKACQGCHKPFRTPPPDEQH
jgi:cytochrome c556